MANISRSALVMYSCEQMYKLVDDIDLYPQFIPNCADAKRIQTSDNTVEGSLLISSVGISKWFTTKNQLTANKEISMQLINGPFKHLTGVWKFIELDQFACKVELELDFEFSSKMIELAFGGIFNNVVANMVSAFTQRAKQIYD
ncbi:MAG: ribosome-associated toxin RatA of RatAB toxin-antitoxin module [Psychrosphaera sp.]|jgi:ribosome-associated toxin RatA of RatAB toxin-antitoxin module|uniref:Type II toxin-antitoxin system RatA family toxin n=1 Tax=Psychrosphaera aquimarina TaxID=2044854 RepID=A0ABU3QZR9_9GAMM|nr:MULTISPECIES: type II toxin-antitoxin system RatA family toxin [Psychrosphaera]MBU2917108.1 type II toxin-antitoxin system RatA family toxin [Psychrosphaera sp. F3M07]MDU0112941.1 type II toxin-antitoxin system RatA family toxin [Psychrosphaera aquimarina]